MPLRTVVTFRSDTFNTAVVRPYFASVNSFGDDVAQHLIFELRQQGVTTGEPEQEDFGWYFRFEVGGNPHLFIIGYRPVERDWLGNIERVPVLFFKPQPHGDAPLFLHRALADPTVFQNVRWHVAAEFDRGEEDRGRAAP